MTSYKLCKVGRRISKGEENAEINAKLMEYNEIGM